MVLSDGKLIFTILGYVDGITLGLDVGTDMGSSGGYFDGSNGGKLNILLL